MDQWLCTRTSCPLGASKDYALPLDNAADLTCAYMCNGEETPALTTDPSLNNNKLARE